MTVTGIQGPQERRPRGEKRRFTNNSQENVMSRASALGLAMLAGWVIGATAVNGQHDMASGAYAILDLNTINNPNVFKTLPSKKGDFDDHTA
jgi:hypothetical protein